MSEKNQKSIVIIVPTLNSQSYIERLIQSIDYASTNIKYVVYLYILDSNSQDETRRLIKKLSPSASFFTVDEFNHGGTRNWGALLGKDKNPYAYVFMTQDSQPVSEDWLRKLLEPIELQKAAATFARQLPRPNASLLEQFSRYFNYPERSQSRTVADIPHLGVKAFFFSNVCSAVRADVFWEVGGFPEHVIMNEDMTLAAKLIRAGYTIRYVAEAEVVHSHDYNLQQQFRRNFDVGAFFADAGPELAGASVGGEGLRFVREQLQYVVRHGRINLLPLVIVEAAAKFTAFQLGRRHQLLPQAIKKHLSMHSYHWNQKKEQI